MGTSEGVRTMHSDLMSVSVMINGEQKQLNVDPTLRLADMLRGEFNLTGTKVSCGIGRCGACSVMINGALVNSCLVMAYQVDQATIMTIEGLSTEEDIDPIQQAFLEEGGYQCGYCTPGMVMAVKALFLETPNPTESQIKTALSGNLCRCTGYGGIIRAVQRVISQTK